MGYTPKRRVYKLVFEPGDDLAGLEIRAQSPSMGEALELAELEATARVAAERGDMSGVRPQLEMFIKYVVTWNLETADKEAIPVSVDGLLTLEPRDVMRILDDWQDAISGVTAPLGQPSNSGAPFPAGLPPMPMETLSSVPMVNPSSSTSQAS
jgi:hypothetical protein